MPVEAINQLVPQLIFGLFALITLGGALGVVTARDMFHAALWLVLSLFGVAGFYMLLEAPFIAGLQLFVYIGGIAVLIVIVIMVARRKAAAQEPATFDPFSAALVALVMGYLLIAMIRQVFSSPYFGAPPPQAAPYSLANLGLALVAQNGYLLPFELTSVLLLAVLVGALYIAKEGES